MGYMFVSAFSFNQPLNNWDVINKSKVHMFFKTRSMKECNKPGKTPC